MKRYIRSGEYYSPGYLGYDADDADDEMDPFRGHKYYVIYGYQHKCVDNPKQAITIWFQQSRKHPMDCAVLAKRKAGAIELVNAATPELLTTLYEKYGCPYKLEYLIQSAEKQRQNNCKYFNDDTCGYGDNVDPFTYG